MGRRLPTKIAIAGLITVAVLVAAIWVIAVADGHVRLLSRANDVAPQFRSNHGPWRSATLRGLHNYATICTVCVAVPAAWLGAVVERSRRAGVVAALAMVALVVNFAHFPLFD